MKNIVLLCSGGDDMPIKSEITHLLSDNTKIDVKHLQLNGKLL